MIGLGEFQNRNVVNGGVYGLGISNAEGDYSVIPRNDRRFTVVPKRRIRPRDGGYRRFGSEFPETRRNSWPWQAQAPSHGHVRLDLDLESSN